jgi:Fructosamine kinase
MMQQFAIKHFAPSLQVRPSVLHGDLWSGNIGSADGQPTIFDPAAYYGHHEVHCCVSAHRPRCASSNQQLFCMELLTDDMAQSQCES